MPDLPIAYEFNPRGDGNNIQGVTTDPSTGERFVTWEEDGKHNCTDRYTDTGKYVSTVKLTGYGHGSNGNQLHRTGDKLWLWSCQESNKVVGRMPWKAGTYSTRPQSWAWLKGWVAINGDYLAVQYTSSGQEYVDVYLISDILKGEQKRIGRVLVPKDAHGGIFQGYTIDHEFVWYVTGPTVGRAGTTPGVGDETVTVWKFSHQTGKELWQREHLRYGLKPGEKTDLNHEPQSMEVDKRGRVIGWAKVGTYAARRLRGVVVDQSIPKVEQPKRLTGVDVSSHQAGWAPAEGDTFVMVKATEGTGYTNPERAAQLAVARADGLVTGHYHWLTPGKPVEQAAYFVANADIRAGDPLWCDWEKQADGTHPTIQDVAAFIAEVQRIVPTSKVGLYCNRNDWTSTAVKAGDGLWIAQYGVDKPNTSTDWVFWQYTDKPIDQNVSKFTSRGDLDKWLKVQRPPVVKPPVVKPPVVVKPDVQPPPVVPPPPVVLPLPQNVGLWAVDPAKVSTVLLGRQGTKLGNELSPATTIADGVEFVKNNVGRYALLRSDGWSYDREYLVQIGAGPVPVSRQFPVIPDYDREERIPFRGGLVCRCLAISLPWVEFAMLEAGIIKFNLDFYQLGYNAGRVKASAASHAEGKMIDTGQYRDDALRIWRRDFGYEMQWRKVSQGFSADHGHGGPHGCPHGSTTGPSNAASQGRAWDAGRDGLRQNRLITGPGPVGKNTPKWDAALSAYLKKIGAPPVKTT